MEQVNDEIDEVEQDPAPGGDPLDMMGLDPPFGEPLENQIGDSSDVSIRGPGGNHEVIGGVRQAPKIQGHDVTGFAIVDRREGGPNGIGQT